MAAKKRRFMPDLDELECKRKQTKSAMKGVEAAVKQLKDIKQPLYRLQLRGRECVRASVK